MSQNHGSFFTSVGCMDGRVSGYNNWCGSCRKIIKEHDRRYYTQRYQRKNVNFNIWLI